MDAPRRVGSFRERLWVYAASWFQPPRLLQEPDYLTEREWASLYSPVGREETGEVVASFAKDQYSLVSSMVGDLDKKADDLMRTTLTVFGAVLAALSTRIVQVDVGWTQFTGALGLLALAFGVVIAALARIPAELATPMTPRELMEVADQPLLFSKSQIQSAVAASYHGAMIGAAILNNWKKRQLHRANRFFLIGMALLFVSFMGNLWTRSPHKKNLEVKFEVKSSSNSPGIGRESDQGSYRRSPVEVVGFGKIAVLEMLLVGCTPDDPIRPPGTGI